MPYMALLLEVLAGYYMYTDKAYYATVKGFERALSTLDKRERKTLIARFNLDGKGIRKLEDVAKEFNVTRERIRQVEAKATRRLRHPARLQIIYGFINSINEYENTTK